MGFGRFWLGSNLKRSILCGCTSGHLINFGSFLIIESSRPMLMGLTWVFTMILSICSKSIGAGYFYFPIYYPSLIFIS